MNSNFIFSIISLTISSVSYAFPCTEGSLTEKVDCLNSALESSFNLKTRITFKASELETKVTKLETKTKELETKLEEQKIINGNLVEKIIKNKIPSGTVVAFAGEVSSIPKGWLYCDGQELSKEEYPELSNALSLVTYRLSSYKFNSNSSHFKLPDYRNVFLFGGNVIGADFSRHDPTLTNIGRIIWLKYYYANKKLEADFEKYTNPDYEKIGNMSVLYIIKI